MGGLGRNLACGQQSFGLLGNVGVARAGPQHAPDAEARGQPVGKPGDGLLRVIKGSIGEGRLGRIEALAGRHRKTDNVEAAAGIEIVMQRRQPFVEQAGDRVRVAQGPRRADAGAGDRAIDAKQRQVDDARALAALLHRLAQIDGEAAQQGFDILDADDGRRQAALGHAHRRGQARGNGLLHRAQRLVEPQQQGLAEAARQRCARALHHLADAAQAKPGKGGNRLLLQPQCGERQGGHGPGGVLKGNYRRGLPLIPAGAVARQRMGSPGGRGDRAAGGEALVEKPREDVTKHCALAAEKIGAAGDVEDEAEIGGCGGKGGTVGLRAGIERHQRRIAIGPVGDRLQQLHVGERVLLDHLDGGGDGACIAQAHAARKPGGCRLLVKRDKPNGIAAPAHHHQRRGLRRRGEPPCRAVAQPRQPVRWQRGEGDAQVAARRQGLRA